MHLGLKDPGSSDSPTSPTTANFITVTRYHVDYVRADGRNTPGVDVPFPFDGAMTLTVGAGNATGSFELVRVQAKHEAPLMALRGGGGAGRDFDDRARHVLRRRPGRPRRERERHDSGEFCGLGRSEVVGRARITR